MKMNLFLVLSFTAGFTYYTSAQNPLSQRVQTELGIGISTPLLHNGSELSRSASIRENGLSYFEDAEGNRRNAGDYGNLIGWSVALAYYIPIKKVNGLMAGSVVRTSLTGTQPESGGYEEGYFFNYLSFGGALKYYPIERNNLFIKADAGLASVFTKNRFLDAQNNQLFFHQFGIGTNASFAVGYSILPFKNKSSSIDLQFIYQYNSTRVEVNGIGNDQWTYSGLTLMAAVNF